ncbi:hypothetical protein FA045_06335 [Pedobacter cryotolerans]|uniref:Uncharacterized protein n=2 Tax=Pedobacter cryotolerans TaxID=2571270 RepID=A0A4U1CAA9_9SPHI|nr:hypothetical protein FA045_06335 [Pedobacter cryotolerans]
MTLLIMAPCRDMDDFASDSVNTSIVYKDSGGDKNFSQETCTPFCTCACCSASRHFIPSQELNFVVKEAAVTFVEYKMPAIAEQFIEIYQPPQIA